MSHHGLGAIIQRARNVVELNDYELIERAKSLSRQRIASDESAVMLELANRLGLRVVTVQSQPICINGRAGLLMIDLFGNCRYLTRWESFMYRMFKRLPNSLKMLTKQPEWPIL